MNDIKSSDADLNEEVTVNLRPDERRQRTDIVFREIVGIEATERHEKTERLRQARLEAERNGL